MTYELPSTVVAVLTEIAAVRGISEGTRPQSIPPGNKLAKLALASWRRADGLARSVTVLAAELPANLDLLGRVSRTFWEGMVTIQYVRRNPAIRVDQLFVGALRTARLVATWQWGQATSGGDLDDESARFVAAATRRETAYREMRNAHKRARRAVDPFDHDECAALPTLETMARQVGTHGRYEVVYRMESARATHWGLHAVVEEADAEGRLLQVTTTIAGCYRIILANCAEILGVDHTPFSPRGHDS